jgi:rSAM/selenodomain-associated transferase 2
MRQVSIIIPTLNEADCLQQTLIRLQALEQHPLEIIIVDGGSTDATRKIAARFGLRPLTTERPGRSVQLNAGARAAQGELLCFLHGDTWVPGNLISLICRTLQDPQTTLGGFHTIMGYQGKKHPFTNWLHYGKTYFAPLLYRPYRCLFKGLRLLFGDQVMFCRKADFIRAGLFDENLPIMEEADLCLKMNRLGRIRQLPERVYTSDRRIIRWGFWKAHSIYISICLLWALGVSPHWLKRFYEEVR